MQGWWVAARKLIVVGGVASVVVLLTTLLGLSQRRLTRTEQALTRSQARQAFVEASLRQAVKRVVELEASSRQTTQLTERLQETERTVAVLKTRLAGASQQIGVLQTRLVLAQAAIRESAAPSTALSDAVELAPVAVLPNGSPGVSGRILQVHPDWEFVVLNLGWDRVSVGDVLQVVRQRQPVAEVQIERVQEQAAAARILPAYRTNALAVDDEVIRP